MNPSRRRAGLRKRAVAARQASGLLIAWCIGQTLLSIPAAAQAPQAFQTPPASRQELMRQWDIDRDGKVDASEAEIARGRMRRARNDAIMNSGPDPVTGRPRVATDPVTGRPVPPTAAAADRGGVSAPAADEGLILVPGNGERPGTLGGTAAAKDMQPRPSPQQRDALPGTRVPTMSSTIPSVAPRLSTGAPVPDSRPRPPGASSTAGRQPPPSPRDAGGADLSSRSRMLPGTAPTQNPGARDPQSSGMGRDQQQPGVRPGIIAGGVRAGTPGARPGYGAGAVPSDLNAGRPAVQPPSVPRPGVGPYRGPTPPGAPAAGVPSVPRPGMGQPPGGRSVSRTPNTVPRVPRMTTDEFYGR